MELTFKILLEIQIATKLDEYFYEKNTQKYFETMPVIGLAESQVALINQYLNILENKNDSTQNEFSELLDNLKKENADYKDLLNNGSKSTLIKKYSRITGYLVRQMEKYNKLF